LHISRRQDFREVDVKLLVGKAAFARVHDTGAFSVGIGDAHRVFDGRREGGA
jgi:hypothetical protein